MFSDFAFFFSSSHSNVPFSGGMFSMEDISGGRLVRSTPPASGATRGRLLSKKRKTSFAQESQKMQLNVRWLVILRSAFVRPHLKFDNLKNGLSKPASANILARRIFAETLIKGATHSIVHKNALIKTLLKF